MFSSKQKIIKSMFSPKSIKKVGKAILKFSLFNEDIRRSQKNRGIREANDDDDDGEDVRVLSHLVVMMVMIMTMVMTLMAVIARITIMGATIVLMEELIVLKAICKG